MHWTITFFGNLAGSLFVTCLIVGYGGVFDVEPFTSLVFSFNEKKVVVPGWDMIFLRGIGANWLVCLACFLSMMAREYFSKVAAVWWPTFAFVCLGFDHVVANMFFVPLSIFLKDPQIGVGYYIWKSMIPALLGNIVGGVVFVASVYWYLVSFLRTGVLRATTNGVCEEPHWRAKSSGCGWTAVPSRQTSDRWPRRLELLYTRPPDVERGEEEPREYGMIRFLGNQSRWLQEIWDAALMMPACLFILIYA